MDTTASWLKFTSLIFIDAIALSGNFLMLMIGLRNNSLRTNQNAFIFNMALSDFLQGVFIMPSAIVSVYNQKWAFGALWCNLFGILKVTFTLSSVYSLSGISIIRYFYVVRKTKYMNTWRGAVTCVVASWCFSVFLSLTPLLGWGQLGFEDGKEVCTVLFHRNLSHTLTVFITGLFLNIVIMTSCYICIFKTLRHSSLTIRQRSVIRDRTSTVSIYTDDISVIQQESDRLNINGNNNDKDSIANVRNATQHTGKPKSIKDKNNVNIEEVGDASQITEKPNHKSRSTRPTRKSIQITSSKKKTLDCNKNQPAVKSLTNTRSFSPKEVNLLKTVFIIVVVFIFCWTPYVLFNLMRLFGVVENINSVDTVTMWLGFLNSAVNPVMYGVLNKQFRRAMKNVFWSKKRRRYSESSVC